MTHSSPARPTPFTRVRRRADRGHYDKAMIHSILDAAIHCHVAHVVDGRPVATPTLHWRLGDTVYWHGSVASRMLRTNAAGHEVCLTATVFDAWVLARSAFNHSVNYRAVMCFGRPQPVEDPALKLEVLEQLMERWFPGRWPQLRPTTRKELTATRLLSLPLDEASAKIRAAPPGDPARDRRWPVWAGLVPLATVALPLVPDGARAARERRPRLSGPLARRRRPA